MDPFLSGLKPLRGVGLVTAGGTETPVDFSAIFIVPNPSSELSSRYPGYYLFSTSTTHLRPRFRGQSADSRGTIFLILWLDKLGTASHFHLAYEVPPNLFFLSPPKFRSSSRFRGSGEDLNSCNPNPFVKNDSELHALTTRPPLTASSRNL